MEHLFDDALAAIIIRLDAFQRPACFLLRDGREAELDININAVNLFRYVSHMGWAEQVKHVINFGRLDEHTGLDQPFSNRLEYPLGVSVETVVSFVEDNLGMLIRTSVNMVHTVHLKIPQPVPLLLPVGGRH